MRNLYSLLFFFLSLNTVLHGNEQAFRNIPGRIERWMHLHHIPGASIALIYEDETYLYNFGFANQALEKPVTSDTIFALASITKVFTSTALAYEVLMKKMALTDPITQYVPELSQSKSAISQVKLIDLATHTSSLPRIPPKLGKQHKSHALISFLNQWSPSYSIGTKYVYSNLAFALLGYALMKAENEESYEEMIHKIITTPLQMNSTYVHLPAGLIQNRAQGYNKKGAVEHIPSIYPWPGGGGLKSSSRDMLKFLKANLDLEGPTDLTKAMQFAQKEFFKVKAHLAMGLGWQRYNPKKDLLIIEKNGGLKGFSSYIGFIPEQKLGIVILANKSKTKITHLGREILLSLLKPNLPPKS